MDDRARALLSTLAKEAGLVAVDLTAYGRSEWVNEASDELDYAFSLPPAPRWLPLSRAAAILGWPIERLRTQTKEWSREQAWGSVPAVRVKYGGDFMERWRSRTSRVEPCDVEFPWGYDEGDLWEYWESETDDRIPRDVAHRFSGDAIPDVEYRTFGGTGSTKCTCPDAQPGEKHSGPCDGEPDAPVADAVARGGETPAGMWRYATGEVGRNRVTVYQRGGQAGTIYLERWEGKKRIRESLKKYARTRVRDREEAARIADKVAAEIAARIEDEINARWKARRMHE